VADRPDFHIDLGDTFRATHLKVVNYQEIEKLHLAQRQFFGLLCHSAPLFLALGNHEEKVGWELDGTPNNVPVWATTSRKIYYPNPVPGDFYTGSETVEPFVGLRENYYAWEWGDALFVVLDPYWYTTRNPKETKDSWDWTIGNEQYRWLKRTLEASSARFKFVFAHHILGEGRGGIELAGLFEWGGHNKQGHWELDQRRPGWKLPIHPLMVANGVTIFFQGHDHVFVKQERDGVVYQECPMPADPTYTRCLETGNCNGPARPDAYLSGDLLENSGHLRVAVSEAKVTVDYVRSWLEKNEGEGRINGQTAYSYTVPAKDKALTTASAASFAPAGAPESIVSAFGNGLLGTSGAGHNDAAGELTVTVRDVLGYDRTAEVLFASDTQVNFVVPGGTASGVAAVTFSRAGQITAVGKLSVEPVAPALFTANANGAGVAAAVVEHVLADGSRTSELTFECSAGPGQCTAVPIDLGATSDQAYLSLYGTGIRNRTSPTDVSVQIGGEDAEVTYAGPQGEFPGLDQVNVRIPKTLANRGDVTIVLTVESKTPNPVTLKID